MASNGNSQRICLYPDQLGSLLSLARVLPVRKYSVLIALLHYLQTDSLKSTATREQIMEITGLGKRTIYSYIREFDECGLLKQWRGPFETKQKFYRINLPVPDQVFSFYGSPDGPGVTPHLAGRKISRSQPRSILQKAISVLEDHDETIVNAEPSLADGPQEAFAAQLPSAIFSEDCSSSFAPEGGQTSPATLENPTVPADQVSLQVVSRDASPNLACDDDISSREDETCFEKQDEYRLGLRFDDPHLELLIDQIELGQKQGTRVFRWFKAENLLTYWPPEDRYRVERQMLRQRVKNLNELNAILTAPVKPEYEWFVTEFFEVCGDNGYEAKDTSQALAFEINMALGSMLRRSYQGRAEWTAESMKAQLREMIENWPQITSKSGLAGLVEQPPAPTLEFFVTNRAAWQAAREKYIDENESKVLRMLGIG